MKEHLHCASKWYKFYCKLIVINYALTECSFPFRDYITEYCKDVSPGGGRIFECLRSHKVDIDQNTKCFASLFKLQKDINQDSTLDAYLVEECKMEIKNFCPEKLLHNKIGSTHSKNLLTCLKLNVNQEVSN